MYCKECGKRIPENAKFCSGCGFMVEEKSSIIQNDLMKVEEKKSGWFVKGIKFSTVIFLAIIVLDIIFSFFSVNYIEFVKQSRLVNYDYGQNIGSALDNWFMGKVTWDSYEENKNVYVTARGECPYFADSFNSSQTFVFKILDDEHFLFVQACDGDGNDIFVNSRNPMDNWYMDFYSDIFGLYGVDIDMHEVGIKAAFGDPDSLAIIQNNHSDDEI